MRKKLIKRRKQNGYSVAKIAAKLDISESFYYKIESGARNPTIRLASEIASLLGGTIDELFFNHKSDDSSSEHAATRDSA